MRLVHKQPVHAEFFKSQRVVFFVAGGEGFEFGFQPFLGLFNFLHQAPVVRVGVFAFNFFQFVQLLLEKASWVSRDSGMRSKPECVTMTASQLPVAMRLKSFLRFCASKSSLPGDEDVCARIQREQFGGKLAEHVIGNGKHRLAGQSQPLQFHRRGNHRVGLARADNVAEQRVGRLQNAPDARLLVQLKLNRRTRARQRQMFAVERADPPMIERVIVKPAPAVRAGRRPTKSIP